MSHLPAVQALLRFLINPGWAPLAVVSLHLILAQYGLTRQFDSLLHFLGGASIAYLLSGVLRSLPLSSGRVPRALQQVLVFTGACTVALFWEFAEFASDRFRGTSMQVGLEETVLDLVFGVAGAVFTLVLSGLFYAWNWSRSAPKPHPAAGDGVGPQSPPGSPPGGVLGPDR